MSKGEMMDSRQRVAIGALGIGYVALKYMLPKRKELHASLAKERELIEWNRGLLVSISDLMNVAHEREQLIEYIRDFCRHDKSSSRTSSFHMNRSMHDIHLEMSNILRSSSRSMNTREMRDQLYVEQDVVPVIKSHLESILHNHMLRELM
jgi:hypothetical protein